MDVRWGAGSVERMRMFAKELVDLQPEAILAASTPATAALQRETRTIPIVFLEVSDPVGSGFIIGLPRPGGSITGFMLQEASTVGKLLELLTRIAPSVTRAALTYNPDTAPYVESYYLSTFGAAARSLKVAPIIAPIHSDAEIATIVTSLGSRPGGGLIGAPDGFITAHRTPIISLAARNNVPAVYPQSVCAREGGLLSYGPSEADMYRRATAYVDRILHGTKPADLPERVRVLSQELNVLRKDLYAWRDLFRAGRAAALRPLGRPHKAEVMAMGGRDKPAPALPEMAAAELEAARKRIAELERKIGQQQLELDFFQQALRQVKEARRASIGPGVTGSTRSSK